jgi:hypothetical protein
LPSCAPRPGVRTTLDAMAQQTPFDIDTIPVHFIPGNTGSKSRRKQWKRTARSTLRFLASVAHANHAEMGAVSSSAWTAQLCETQFHGDPCGSAPWQRDSFPRRRARLAAWAGRWGAIGGALPLSSVILKSARAAGLIEAPRGCPPKALGVTPAPATLPAWQGRSMRRARRSAPALGAGESGRHNKGGRAVNPSS